MKKRKSIIITTLVALLSLTVVLTGCETNNAKNESTTTVSTTVTKEEITTTTTTETTTTTKPETTTTTTTPETTTTVSETTAETTTTAPETTTTTTTPETTVPAPQWTESECNKTMYINTGCYSRKEAVMGAETAKLYNVNDKVTITATTDTGYGKLSDGTFIHLDYLSDSKVSIVTTTKPQTNPSQLWTETECRSLTMDVLVDCNAYDKPISGANIVKSYKLNDRVKVVAKTDTGYYKLTDGSYIKEYNIRSYEDQGCYYKYDYPIYEWTEEEIFYVFDEVKKYADSVGFTNYDFPTEIMPYNESTKSYYGFNNYDMYKILGYEWEDNGYLWYRTKEEQMNDLIHDLKVFVDDHMDPDCAISSEKVMFTVTTAIDFQPHIKDTYNEKDAAILLDELNRHCYPDKCYILIYNC